MTPSSEDAQALRHGRRPRLVLHYREGCHLCEDMEQQLHELLPVDSFQLVRIDIDEDERLREAFNVRVPVLSLIPLSATPVTQSAGEMQPASDSVETATLVTGLPAVGAVVAESDADLSSVALIELCEHFLDLQAVSEALASYNRGLLEDGAAALADG